MDTINKYLSKVKHHLTCSKATKKKVLSSFRMYIEDMLDGNLDIPMKEYYKEFGEPKAAAQNYMEEIEPREVKLYKRRKKYILLSFFVLIISALLIICWTFISNANSDYSFETVPPVQVTNPEIDASMLY